MHVKATADSELENFWRELVLAKCWLKDLKAPKAPNRYRFGAFGFNNFPGGRRWYRTTDPLLVRQVLSP
jgi:hypothetical protein